MELDQTQRSTSTARGNITRRTLVKSAAWSVPVIAAAAAAPFVAASADACVEQSVEITGIRMLWNDGADGENSTGGTHQGWPVYGRNKPMFAGITIRNDGNSTLSGFRVTFNLRVGSWATGSTSSVAIGPGNVHTAPTFVPDVYQTEDTPHLDAISYWYDDVILEPGETMVFRIYWNTAHSTGGQFLPSGLYSIVEPRSILCNGVSVPRRLQDEGNTRNNDARPVNEFFVASS